MGSHRSYGLVADMNATALVATDGTVDWRPVPHRDSPPICASSPAGRRWRRRPHLVGRHRPPGNPLPSAGGAAKHAIAVRAEQPRQTIWVGISTADTMLGHRSAPRLIDLSLRRNCVRSQQTQQELPRADSNLGEPQDADQDRRAHGPFYELAHDKDPQLWVSLHRHVLLGFIVSVAVASLIATVRWPR